MINIHMYTLVMFLYVNLDYLCFDLCTSNKTKLEDFFLLIKYKKTQPYVIFIFKFKNKIPLSTYCY